MDINVLMERVTLAIEWVMVLAIVGLLVLSAWLECGDQAREQAERKRRAHPTPPLHVIRRRRPYDWQKDREVAQ